MFPREHGITIHLPLIRRFFPGAPALLLTVRNNASDLQLLALRAHLLPLLREGGLLLLSMDLSHHRTPSEALREDARTLAALRDLRTRDLRELDLDCPRGAALFLSLMRELGADAPVLLERGDSGTPSGGRAESCTSFAAILYRRRAPRRGGLRRAPFPFPSPRGYTFAGRGALSSGSGSPGVLALWPFLFCARRIRMSEPATILTAADAVAYVRRTVDFFSPEEPLTAEILEGDRPSVDSHANRVALVRSGRDGRSLFLKQMFPYLTAIPDVAVADERIRIEVGALRLWDVICPGSVPKVLFWDETNKILILEDLSRMRILSAELLRMRRFPRLPRQLGTFLGRVAFYTSGLFLDPETKRAREALFHSVDTKGVWVRFSFDGVLDQGEGDFSDGAVARRFGAFREDRTVREEFRRLRELYRGKRQCLIHSDLLPANIFVDEEEMRVFDTEYADFGPISYDIGKILGSLLLIRLSCLGLEEADREEVRDYRDYLLGLVRGIYGEFERTFAEAWEAHLPSDENRRYYRDFALRTTREETLGYLACTLVGRLSDGSLGFEFRRIADPARRRRCLLLAIEQSQTLLKAYRRLGGLEDLEALLRETEAAFPAGD
jgi:5-methylthioribose kinase